MVFRRRPRLFTTFIVLIVVALDLQPLGKYWTMKKLLLVLSTALLLSAIPACNDDKKTDSNADNISVNDVPEAVRTAFAAKYPGAADVQWENATEDGTKTYKAKFEANGVKKKAEFGSGGNFIKED